MSYIQLGLIVTKLSLGKNPSGELDFRSRGGRLGELDGVSDLQSPTTAPPPTAASGSDKKDCLMLEHSSRVYYVTGFGKHTLDKYYRRFVRPLSMGDEVGHNAGADILLHRLDGEGDTDLTFCLLCDSYLRLLYIAMCCIVYNFPFRFC